jgi:putative pyruvate formate lyase activating enzyme
MIPASDTLPSYLQLFASGELQKRAQILKNMMKSCSCCPHTCQADRVNRKYGKCYSGALPIISAYTSHFGEEPVLSGTQGVGNIFFGNCNLRCSFCQNHEISQKRVAELQNEVSIERLAEIMLELQDKGCHSIGLVSPTHFTAPILEALCLAIEKGLQLPLIYNTNGYDSVEVLRLFDGVVDIYLPDFKYGSDEAGETYSGAEGYYTAVKAALIEMFRQTGSSLTYKDGIVVRGLIIRHLVLPNDIADTEHVLSFIANELSPDVHVSLMSQYFPAHKAAQDILMSRPIRESEYQRALLLMEKLHIKNGWVQEFESRDNYKPDFLHSRTDPFHNECK